MRKYTSNLKLVNYNESLIGKKIGDLTIIKLGIRDYPHLNTSHKLCYTECKCGNKKWIQLRNILKREQKNCGKGNCHRSAKKLIGLKFNRLTIISHHSKEKGYVCICDCGKETIAKIYGLKSGKHKSCGCYTIDSLIKRFVKPNFYALKIATYSNYKASAKKKEYEFSISIDSFFKLMDKDCNYCGLPPSGKWNGAKRTISDTSEFRYSGVDRVDNNIGYIESNCVSCCHICNDSKKNLSLEKWKEWIIRTYNYLIKN